MKRSPLPRRRKPLARSAKPIKRSWLKRGPSKRKRTRPQGGNFVDKRSHVVHGRTILYGWDMKMLRQDAYKRSKGRCEAKKHAKDCPIRVTWFTGELDHIRTRGMGGSRRDDVLENVQFVSKPCHRKKHS